MKCSKWKENEKGLSLITRMGRGAPEESTPAFIPEHQSELKKIKKEKVSKTRTKTPQKARIQEINPILDLEV